MSENTLSTPDQKSKILRVSCELAPVADNPGLFWIGWTRPLGYDGFRQLRRCMLCWRAADLNKNGTPGLDEGWRITGDGLEQASLLGYEIVINGVVFAVNSGNYRAQLGDFLARPKATRPDRLAARKGDASAPVLKKAVDCALAPILVKFLRPEGAIMGADLREYGPFCAGEVAPIPYAHACVFIANGAAEIYG